MTVTRFVSLFLASAVTLSALACVDADGPLTPIDPQFAKGGKPGAPDETLSVELLEYYVYQEGGRNYVHLLAKGKFPVVNLNAVQDYIFNGIRDDDFSIFYEYTTLAPAPVSVEDLAAEGLAVLDESTGAWHIDIPWEGEGLYADYTDPDNPVLVAAEFPDFPHVGLNSGIGDPYAFDIRFQKENDDHIASFQPQGIILGGVEQNVPSMAWSTAAAQFHTGTGTIYSYATYVSSMQGVPIFIDDIILDETSFTCEVKTTRDRKTKTTKTVTAVSGGARVILSTGVEGDPVPDAWVDVLLAEFTGKDDEPRLLDSFTSTSSSGPWASGWGIGAQIDGALESVTLQLAVPYVYATDWRLGTVYNPAGNPGRTGDWGWFTVNQQIITAPGSWPMALTRPFTVDCGK